MLVLSRKIGERVLIGDGIVVQVLEANGGRIRLGVEAPAEVRIWREELSEPVETSLTCQGTVRKPR